MGTNYNPPIVTDGLVFCVDAGNQRSYPKSGTTWANPRDFYFFNRTASSEFSGTIYFFRFYNRALTAAEVSINFNATRHRFGV